MFAAFLLGLRGKRSPEVVAAKMADEGYSLARTSLWRYETNKRVPDVGALAAIAIVYGVSFERLCTQLAAEILGREIPEWKPEVLTDEERELLAIYRGLEGSSGRDPWVAVGREMVPIQARAGDVVG